MNSKLIGFVLFLLPMLVFGNSLGITKQQLEARYGSPSVKMSMGKTAGKEVTACAFTLTGATVFSLVDNTVVEIKYSFEKDSVITETELWDFVCKCDIGPDWVVTKTTNNETSKVVETKKTDGSTGVLIKRNMSMMAVFRLGSWLKVKEDYDKQPWYKKIL